MPNPFQDWARMYGANKQYLESQGAAVVVLRADRRHPEPDAQGRRRHGARHEDDAPCRAGQRGGCARHVAIDGVWHVGSYINVSPVLRVQGRVTRDYGTPPYTSVFDEVVAQTHVPRVQAGTTIAVLVDPRNPADMAIDRIGTGRLGPPPPGTVPGPGAPGARPV
jgi:hypothetical protein